MQQPDRRKREAERAVIDRIEGDLAVLLVGDAEDEFHVDISKLPKGAEENTVLLVGRVPAAGSHDGLIIISFHGEDRRRAQTEESMRDRLAALRNRD